MQKGTDVYLPCKHIQTSILKPFIIFNIGRSEKENGPFCIGPPESSGRDLCSLQFAKHGQRILGEGKIYFGSY